MDFGARFHDVFYIRLRLLLQIIGHDLFKVNFRTYYTYLLYGLFVTFLVTQTYSMIKFDFFVTILSITFFCFSIQFVVKIFVSTRRDEVMAIIDFINHLYDSNKNNRIGERGRIFPRYMFYTEFLFKYGAVLYGFALINYYISALYMYIFENELTTVIPNYIPGVDHTTIRGYLVHLTYHTILIVFAVLGLLSSDILFVLLVANIPIMADLIRLEVDELNELLMKQRQNQIEIKYRLRNLIMMHKEMTEVLNDLQDLAHLNTTTEISMASVALTLLIFILITNFYIPAVTLFSIFFFQLISFCALGTIIELTNDRVYNSINSCKWNLLDNSGRRQYTILLQFSQLPPTLTVYVLPLNMVTFVQILKSIYSYTMIMYTMYK